MYIRKATEIDILQLTELKKPKTEIDREKFLENQNKRLREMVEGKAIYLIAEENNHILGHVFLKFYGTQTEPNFPNLEDLYVDESERSKGVGSQLISEGEKIVKEKGFTKVGLAVNPTLNPRAKALYERLGYKQTTTKPYMDGVYDGVEDWCVDMAKDLL